MVISQDRFRLKDQEAMEGAASLPEILKVLLTGRCYANYVAETE
jgi:hypothetical protein